LFLKLRNENKVIAANAKQHCSSWEEMFGSNCMQSQILWPMGYNMARRTGFIFSLHFSTQLYFVLICLSLACFTISVVHNCTLFDLLVISLFCNKYLLFYFLLYFIFCRWNLFPMATFHLGLILPLVAVCECFRCSSLFSLSYVIDSLLFLFPFSSVQLCSFKK
jgi:hypothetical protein